MGGGSTDGAIPAEDVELIVTSTKQEAEDTAGKDLGRLAVDLRFYERGAVAVMHSVDEEAEYPSDDPVRELMLLGLFDSLVVVVHDKIHERLTDLQGRVSPGEAFFARLLAALGDDAEVIQLPVPGDQLPVPGDPDPS